MYAQLPSAFAPLFPVDIRSLKGKVIVATVLILLTIMLLFFTVIFAVGYSSTDNACSDAVLYWICGTLSLEALLIFLLFIFSVYIWKTSPTANAGRDLYREKKDVPGYIIVALYFVLAVFTIGWSITFLGYIIANGTECVGTGIYVAACVWIPITIFTSVIPTRVWHLLFCFPWKKLCGSSY